MIELWIPKEARKVVLIVDGKRIQMNKKDVEAVELILRDYVEMKEE